MQILSPVLEMIPSPFAIRLAIIASQKELVDLDKWLSINLSIYKDFFFEVISTALSCFAIDCFCHTSVVIHLDHRNKRKNCLTCIVWPFRSASSL